MELHLTATECHFLTLWDHTCHPTQVNTPRLNLSQTSRYSTTRKDVRLSWPNWLHTEPR